MQVEAAARGIDARKPFREITLQIGFARGLHKQALPVARADDGKRRFNWSQNLDQSRFGRGQSQRTRVGTRPPVWSWRR